MYVMILTVRYFFNNIENFVSSLNIDWKVGMKWERK